MAPMNVLLGVAVGVAGQTIGADVGVGVEEETMKSD